ncbi:hypothetical protein [Bradyrhizobium sp. USDA 3458]|uniref:hypothetical protein n=1 Tax=Bradyrhizobium sp. USDA 3458 TaxID=2591461 RepID=UPI001143A51D|nr:hypothetical protein [Bradyrhizobium sp. USDA 3458]
MEIQSEQAFEYLIQQLAQIPPNIGRHSLVALRYAHLYMPDVVSRFWQTRTSGTPIADLSDEHYTVFYDAAWELARIGVLRPGRVAPRNMDTANDFGDHWSITKFGFEWLEKASLRPFLDMSRMSQVLAGFVPQFGAGFGQRAVEAVRTYRTTNYLASCSMAGAAAESILLAAAIAKSGDEAKTLKMYESSGGRARVTTYVTGQATSSVQRKFVAALHILHYWRDDAAHGQQTTISEVEAYSAISELLRLAQFVSDQWADLTR